MENHSPTNINTIISMISASVSIVMANFQEILSIVAALIAIVSGCMAIRHYYYSTKDVKKRLKQ